MARPKCPKCGSRDNVPILYGLPIGEAFEQEKAGKIKLGGCLVSPENPNRYCRNCGNEWKHGAVKFEDDSDRAEVYFIDDRELSEVWFSPTCIPCAHLQGHMICDAFPDGIPEKIWNGWNDHTKPYAGDHGIGFEKGESTSTADARRKRQKAAKAEPKPEPKKDKKLIRFQLPANPTAAEIDKFTEWIKGQASNANPTKKED